MTDPLILDTVGTSPTGIFTRFGSEPLSSARPSKICVAINRPATACLVDRIRESDRQCVSTDIDRGVHSVLQLTPVTVLQTASHGFMLAISLHINAYKLRKSRIPR